MHEYSQRLPPEVNWYVLKHGRGLLNEYTEFIKIRLSLQSELQLPPQ